MTIVVSLGVFRRCTFVTQSVFYRAFSTSRYLGYHTSSVRHAIGTPTNPVLSTDYGKYYVPGKFESIYQWFVESRLVETVEMGLTAVHDYTGLPWCVTIVVCTIALRLTVTTPLFVWQSQKMFKHRMLAPVLAKISQQLKMEADEAAKKLGWDNKTRDLQLYNSFYKHRKQLYSKHKVPGTLRRYLLPWVQLPLWFSMTAALRHLTFSLPFTTTLTPFIAHASMALSQQGCLWFPNLCAPDPYFVLPFLFGFVNLAVIEVHRGDGKTPLLAMQWFIVNLLRTMSVFMIPVACYMPSGVVLYWLTSSGFGLAQALAMQSIRFKRLLRLPVSPSHSATPYRDILSRFKLTKPSEK